MTISEEGCVVVEGELEELLELFELVERIGWLERLELLFLKVFFFAGSSGYFFKVDLKVRHTG